MRTNKTPPDVEPTCPCCGDYLCGGVCPACMEEAKYEADDERSLRQWKGEG
jgi:TPP-dependent indolepyruvate ferredoxin oxidoreductase alpha subunit